MTSHLDEGFPASGELSNAPETFAEGFKEARDNFYNIPFDETFVTMCTDRNIDIENTAHPAYWAAVSDFSRRDSTEQRANGAPESQVALNDLVASTADYLYNQTYLDRNREKGGPNVHMAKRMVSDYNGMVRDVASAWPDLKASELTKGLTNIANASIEHSAVKHNAPGILRNTIRGAQHEIAFAQILDHTGRPYRTSNITEDLLGIDYVVENTNGSETSIDVKASMHDIQKRGSQGPYVRTSRGQLIIHSMLDEHELNDGFTISEDVAARKAATVETILSANEQPALAYRS